MNNFDEWSQIISRFLKAEADLLTSVTKHEIAADSTRAAFIRGVLEPFLPGSYAIGSGRIIDSAGQSSDNIDIVIYRRDFPRLNLPGSSDVFLYESVLATIEVRTKLIRKSLFDALDTCASIARLNPAINSKILQNIATQNKLKLNDQNQFVHQQPLLTDRFNLIGRPPAFIYGFSGFQTSPGQLNDNVKIWLEQRRNDGLSIDLSSLPAVIATQGCIGWRNAAPLSANSNHLFGIGADTAPIRLIVFHLLYQINRRLKVTPDGYGLKPSVEAYLNKMAPPEIQYTVGKATNSTASVPKTEKKEAGSAKSKSPVKSKSATASSRPVAETKPAPESRPAAKSRPVPEAKPVIDPEPVPEAITVTKPAPKADSKPAPEPQPEAKPTPEASASPPRGKMYHPDPTLWEMPIPDASLVPEHEPESDPFIETLPASTTGFISDSETTAPATKTLSPPEPEPGIDPFIQTMRVSPPASEPTSKPAAAPAEQKEKPEPDPFLQTVRIPAADSVSESDPFAKTIPGLQNPPKSVH